MRLLKVSERRNDKLLDYRIDFLNKEFPNGKDHQSVVNLEIIRQDIIGFSFRGRRNNDR